MGVLPVIGARRRFRVSDLRADPVQLSYFAPSNPVSAYEDTAGGSRRMGAFDSSPEHIVQFVFVYPIFLGEVHPGRFLSSDRTLRIAIGQRYARRNGRVWLCIGLTAECGKHGCCGSIEVCQGS